MIQLVKNMDSDLILSANLKYPNIVRKYGVAWTRGEGEERGRMSKKPTDRQKYTNRHTDTQTDTQTDRQTDRLTDRQTDTHTHTHTHTDRQTERTHTQTGMQR